MKTRLDDIWLFIEVSRVGSLSEAAEILGMPVATLSRRLRGLEAELGLTLLRRKTHGIETTSEGRDLIERCRLHLSTGLDEIERFLEVHGHPQGILRVAAPVSLAERTLVPWGLDYMALYPDVCIEFLLGQDQSNCQDCDLEIVIAPMLDTTRKTRRLISTDYALVAAPEYLDRKGMPARPDDLASHDRIVCLPDRAWRLSRAGETRVVRGEVRLATNVHEVACNAARRGIGIANIGKIAVAEDLETGRLQRVLPDWVPERSDIYLSYSGDGPVSSRLRSFIDYISQRAKALEI